MNGVPTKTSMKEQSLELVHFLDQLKAVKGFVFDVDGVFTDNKLLVTEEGELLRSFHVRDGQGIKYALQAGFPIGIITGGRSKGVTKRLTALGIQFVYSGAADKQPYFEEFLQIHGLLASDILYIGDDIPDLEIMKKVGLAVCPSDAVAEVRAVADYISPLRGGEGIVRDVLEKVMKVQGKWVI
jgi:3-deoxy-D-manno-octulosonate 8-phosphate phosphatase (KDO 8-P phosphatase)